MTLLGSNPPPPERAVVLCVDEKSQVQALDRSQPLLPMRPGQAERRTHDYKRNGTTSLFAALDVKAGTIVGKCMTRHRATEFRKFLDEVERNVPADLDIHVVMDNYGTHKTKLIRNWFAKRPRWHVHFTPTSASWINQVERFFALLTDRALKRGISLGAARRCRTHRGRSSLFNIPGCVVGQFTWPAGYRRDFSSPAMPNNESLSTPGWVDVGEFPSPRGTITGNLPPLPATNRIANAAVLGVPGDIEVKAFLSPSPPPDEPAVPTTVHLSFSVSVENGRSNGFSAVVFSTCGKPVAAASDPNEIRFIPTRNVPIRILDPSGAPVRATASANEGASWCAAPDERGGPC